MIDNIISILIERRKKSFFYKVDSTKNSFANNWKNNSLDVISILKGGRKIRSYQCQTVANHPDYDTHDTIADGKFQVRCFVDPRLFHGHIHAIINTFDVDGEWVDHNAMQNTAGGFQNGRWLIHDRYSFKTGNDTNFAWSGGCFILSSRDLEDFNDTLVCLGVQKGQILDGTIRTA